MMKLTDFGKRTLGTVAASVLVVFLITFAMNPWISWLIYITIGTLTGIAIWEYTRFVQDKGGELPFIPLLTVAAASLFVVFTGWISALAPLVIGLFLIAILHFRQQRGAILDLACSWFAIFYIVVPMGMLFGILYHLPSNLGNWWLAFLIAVTKMTDVGGYLGGMLLGNRKLAPEISPKKTVEGALCGLLFALMTGFLFFTFSPLHLGRIEWCLLALFLGIVSLIGDLVESLLKRDAHRKDSNALPGFGGILDEIDSLLCTTPFLYLYLTL